MGTTGHFVVHLAKGKLYSLGDNIARQQLAEPFSQQVGSGIDTSTGSFGTSATDLSIQGGPLPIVFTRYYRGHSDRYGELGFRWAHSFDTFASTYANGDVAVVFGAGKEEYFQWDSGSASFAPVDGRITSTLAKVTVGSDLLYQYQTKAGVTYYFQTNSDGFLISIQDRTGNQLTVYRDTGGRITSIADDAGRAITLAYDANNRLATASDPEGGTVTYSYDSTGDLVAVEHEIGGGSLPARTEYT
jgi:YD repeat-containing protein